MRSAGGGWLSAHEGCAAQLSAAPKRTRASSKTFTVIEKATSGSDFRVGSWILFPDKRAPPERLFASPEQEEQNRDHEKDHNSAGPNKPSPFTAVPSYNYAARRQQWDD